MSTFIHKERAKTKMNLISGTKRETCLKISKPLSLVAAQYQAHPHLKNNPSFDGASNA